MHKKGDENMKKFHENIWYGTLKECVDELYSLIDDVKNGDILHVDYAAIVKEDAKTAYEAYREAESWFGFRNVSNDFDCDTLTLLFGHYGGGGIECLELTGEDPETDKEEIMRAIANSTEALGIGRLEPNDYTVFEF